MRPTGSKSRWKGVTKVLYEALLEALNGTGIPVAEYAWDTRPDGNYITVAIDGEANSLQADGHKENQSPQGTVDLYTGSADREAMQSVQAALNGLDGCAWYLNSTQYEDDTRLLHWEWVFSLETW